MKTAYWISVIILVAILIFGCSPARRLDRLTKLHPELVKTDTIIQTETIYTESSSKDTVVELHHFLSSKDTVVIHKDHLTERIYHYHDSLFIKGECSGDTIIREIKVPVKTLITSEKSIDDWRLIATIAMLCFVLGFVFRGFIK